MAERIHITTAITYSNGPPHVGHAYEYLVTDTYVRHWRRKLGSANLTFVTGTDEHGQKNRDAAIADGLSPKAFADKISALFRQAHAALNVSYDYFVRTTDPAHKKFVQEMLSRTHAAGDIVFKEYAGLYCIGCERFYTDKELIDATICPVHNRPVEHFSESNYFLKLEKYRDAIRRLIESNPGFIRPERYAHEALRMLDEPLDDLCISRPKARLDWGIDLPFDDKYVTYVWYDALCAYLSELPGNDYTGLREILPVTEHFIGKDILKPHAVYWPAMLMAVGLPVYRRLNVHGWLNFRGGRFSKSSGNIADPLEYEKTYGHDVLRYFVLRDVVYGLDGDFSDERLIERYNADLANDLGNFASRVLAMAARYFKGEITVAPAAADSDDAGFVASFTSSQPGESLDYQVGKMIEMLNFKGALERVWLSLDAANKYVVATSPFTLAKDPAKLARVAQILSNLLEGLRVIAGVLEPFMPATAVRLFDLLGIDERAAHLPFGQGLKPGHRVKPATALFPRIEKPPA
ncbi:MAG TPA: methionine--tRNA ligase [Candidatus Binataceae bacterium]|nr:methionine--tRNA ligase [Candidatus Binataceae bacterium]